MTLHLKHGVRGRRLPVLLGVDPDEPSLRAWPLSDGAYVELASVTGAERLSTSRPRALTFCPDHLVR